MTPLRACAGATILGMVVVFLHAAFAQTGSSPAYFPYPPGVISADLDQEIQRVQREVDQIFQQALAQWRALPINSSTRMLQVQLLGKLLLFDKNLSVNRNQACSFCHMPYTAFTGPISSLNATAVAYPGSVPWRFGHRKPQSYTYAPFYYGKDALQLAVVPRRVAAWPCVGGTTCVQTGIHERGERS
jgi:cytochrome c peroxidase